MDAVDSIVDPLREVAKDSVRLVKCCHKPNHKEFTKVVARTVIGFVIMGIIGLSVKLIFIPINNILVGSGLVAMGVPATAAGGTHLRGMDLVDAWKVACADSSGHVIIHMPAGKSYQIWPMTLVGPCRATL